MMSLVRDLLNHWISRDGVPKMVFKKINFTCILILSIILYAGVLSCEILYRSMLHEEECLRFYRT